MATKAAVRNARQNVRKALAHELRGEMLTLFSERRRSPSELARALDTPLANVEYHLRKLLDFECIEKVGERQVRGATEHFYKATELHLVATEDWEALDPATKASEFGQFVQAQLDVLVAAARTPDRDKNFHLTTSPLPLDEAGRDRALEIVERARAELGAVGEASVDRLAESGGEGASYFGVITLVELPP